ncbi:replication protein A 32 kDa subunit-like [Osmia lignaria lignaria]|uniref:replication protein A 32 kDa subunit-like n=1 Tax=Osmia lignaria lignaria TaxID=1437193 RepID=UPI0014795502|nr:replication protein A 32 kDa subunit-like [Osmia lignaria]
MWGNPTLNATVANTSGGFLNDSQDSKRGTSKRVENVIPIMIRHLTQSNDDLQLWGIPVHIVTFVGIVRKIERTTTKVTYEIEDDTGSVTAFHWLATTNKPEPPIKLNSYVKIYGHKREQNQKKCVLILKMRPLIDLNELTNHLLEVTYVTLKAEKIFNIEKERHESAGMHDVTMTDDNVNGLTKEQVLVFKVIQAENDNENGIERDVLKTRVSKNLLPYLDDILDFLISEGHIYTTLTDDHFKTT